MLLILATLRLGVDVLLKTSGAVPNESCLFPPSLRHLLIFPPFVRAEALSFIHPPIPLNFHRLRSHSYAETLDKEEAGFECCILAAAKEVLPCVGNLAPPPPFDDVGANCGYETWRKMSEGRGST